MCRALYTLLIILIIPTYAAAENRCGWLDNPTPANVFLSDKEGTWTVSWQGGVVYNRLEKMPNFGKEYVYSGNASYGYGCACVKGTTDKKTERFSKVKSIKALPLKVCRKDKDLNKHQKLYN